MPDFDWVEAVPLVVPPTVILFSGKKAIHRLMKGVYEVPTRSRYYKKCIKDGDEKKAIDDFLSLKPDKVKKSLSRAGVSRV